MKKLLFLFALMAGTAHAEVTHVTNCTVQFNNGTEVQTEQCHKYSYSVSQNGSTSIAIASRNHVVIFVSMNNDITYHGDIKSFKVDGTAVATSDRKILNKQEISGKCDFNNKGFHCEAGDFVSDGLFQ